LTPHLAGSYPDGMDGTRLEVTEEMLERVVFGMENQKDRLYLDPSDGVLRGGDEDDGTLIPLPPWGPTEGYRLMDRFTGTLPDSPFRAGLYAILHSGSGVFRRFKDALKDRPEMEGLWRRYKMREMRRSAVAWLSRWSEALELASLGPEPEDLDDLVLEDFSLRAARDADIPVLEEWDRASIAETYPDLTAQERRNAVFRERGEAEFAAQEVILAENAAGEPVGFAWMHLVGDVDRREGRLLQLYVRPDYRGLGLGRLLAERAFGMAEDAGIRAVSARTAASSHHLDGFLERQGFRPVAVFWRRSE